MEFWTAPNKVQLLKLLNNDGRLIENKAIKFINEFLRIYACIFKIN